MLEAQATQIILGVWKITIYEIVRGEFKGQYPPLFVKTGITNAPNNTLCLLFAIGCNSGIPLTLSTVKITMVAFKLLQGVRQLLHHGLNFLQPYYIRGHFFEAFHESFFINRSQSIYIPGNKAQHLTCCILLLEFSWSNADTWTSLC